MATFTFEMSIAGVTGSEVITTSDARAIEYLDDLRNLHYPEIDDGAGGTRVMTRQEVAEHHLAGHRRGEIEFARAKKQNRLDAAVANLEVAGENLTAAESRIRDADIAFETALFVRNQILVSAGVSILAQANTLPQQALTLLQ